MRRVEPLTSADLPIAARFGAAFFAETKMGVGFRDDLFIRVWTALIEQDIGVILGLKVEGEVVGGMAAMVCPGIYTGVMEAQELFIYIDPAHRGGAAFVRLMKAYERWARGKGVQPENMRVACMEGAQPDKLERAFRRLGYVPLERHFQKRGDHA